MTAPTPNADRCPSGYLFDAVTGLADGPCGGIGCCASDPRCAACGAHKSQHNELGLQLHGLAPDRWSAMVPDPHPPANCGPLVLPLPPGVACPTCGTVPDVTA